MYILIVLIVYFCAIQIYIPDFSLLSGKVNYKIQLPQCITYLSGMVCISLFFLDCTTIGICTLLITILGVGLYAIVAEWILAKINSKLTLANTILRLLMVLAVAFISYYLSKSHFIASIVFGIYTRNCMFGVVSGKNLFIASRFIRKEVYKDVETVGEISVVDLNLPSFANAGNNTESKELKKYIVSDLGIIPDSRKDQTSAINNMIEKVGNEGGGILYFPKGKYYFGKAGTFIVVNHSNITIEGELNSKGEPVAELILTSNLASGKKYPWLSPFLITTGESLQDSNIFFGLQFRNRKKIIMRSNSLSDPGSDGNLIEPKYVTKIIADSIKGSRILKVADTTNIGKYIMIGMFNTEGQNALLRNLLGVDVIRPEWQAASRAADEEAPSFQWLAEVRRIVDSHTLELTVPLFEDCSLRFTPEIYNVEMLENISIKNIKISSAWNGLFRHHGYRKYYTAAQAQEMDYGWNAINMKRVAHGEVKNVIIDNFTNPLYVLDSRNITCSNILIKGYDGHQGIKVYEHSCDNLFQNIVFLNHYADMIGGEGNAYCNVFKNIKYLNPIYKPVEFDYHGFSEGPMSPPMFMLFENIYGFSRIHLSGSKHMQPSCAKGQIWWNCVSEGEVRNGFPIHVIYPRTITNKYKYGTLIKCVLKNVAKRKFSLGLWHSDYKKHMHKRQDLIYDDNDVYSMIKDWYIVGMKSELKLQGMPDRNIQVIYQNKNVTPKSIHNYQINNNEGINS